jgi:hypothetical protein
MPGYARSAWGTDPFAADGYVRTGADRPLDNAASGMVRNGDYVLDSNGNRVASDPILERVMFYLSTIKGTHRSASGAMPGSSFVRIRHNNPGAGVTVRSDVLRALAPMISSGEISNVQVVADPYDHDQSTSVNFYRVTYDA